MSDLGNNLPPRNASGRFIKRTAVPIPQSPADNLEPDPVPIPAPTPRTVTQPSADKLEPDPAPASAPTLRLIAQPSELEPRTPSPPAPLTTPAHSTTPNTADNEAPLPAPDFGNLEFLSPDSSIHTSTDSESPPPAAASWDPPTLGQQSTNLAAPLRPLLLPRHQTVKTRKTPHATPAMSQPATQRSQTGPAAMPPPRSSRAPLFSGSVTESIEDFINEYEEYADSCGLTDRQKAQTITRYFSRELRDHWKSHDGYITGNWRDLRRELMRFYAGSSAQRRHSEEKLKDFARATSKLRMRSEDDVLQYYRRFMLLSQPLLDSRRLTIDAHNKIFWRGFHKKDRSAMKARLIAENTRQPAGVHFDYLDVYEVARAIQYLPKGKPPLPAEPIEKLFLLLRTART